MSESQPGQPSDSSVPNSEDPDNGEGRFALSQEPVTAEGPQTPLPEDAVPAPAYEHLGELPATYGTQSVYLVAYDPRQLFAYWDVDWASAPDARYVLRVCRADGELETALDITAADAGRYLAVQRPGGTYYVELGSRGRDGAFQPLAFSGRVTMPPEGFSGEIEPKFATLPFHLSFQRLLELIQNAMGTGENLTSALSRLQQGDQPQVAALLNHIGHLNGEQLHTLESLLGRHLAVEGGASPTGGSESNFLRDRPEAAPSAVFGSEDLSSGAFGSEKLSSGMSGSENLSSGAFGSAPGFSVGASGSETLSSGSLGLTGLSSERLSSGGFGSETLASGSFGSEAWQLAHGGPGGGSDLLDSERAALFLKAMEHNLDVLGSLFSAFGSPGGSDGFSAGHW